MRMMDISLSCKRIVNQQLASNSSAANHILCRHGNALSSRFLVNSSAGWNAHTPLRYFSSGVPSQQGEEGSANMIKLWKKQESLESTIFSFLKSEKQKEHHFTHMQRETEKLQEEMKKKRTELRYIQEAELAKQNGKPFSADKVSHALNEVKSVLDPFIEISFQIFFLCLIWSVAGGIVFLWAGFILLGLFNNSKKDLSSEKMDV